MIDAKIILEVFAVWLGASIPLGILIGTIIRHMGEDE